MIDSSLIESMRSFRHGHSPFFRIFLRVTTSSLSSVCRSFRTHVPTHSCRPMKPFYAAGPDPNGFGGVVIVSRLMPLFGLTALCNPLACKRNHQAVWAVPVMLAWKFWGLKVHLTQQMASCKALTLFVPKRSWRCHFLNYFC